MNMRGILFVLPLCAGLLAGCDNNRAELTGDEIIAIQKLAADSSRTDI